MGRRKRVSVCIAMWWCWMGGDQGPIPPTYASHVHSISPSVQCSWCDGGVCTQNEHTWCRGWGDGGWRMCHFPLVDQRLARLDRWPRGWATCSAWVGYDERDMSRRFLTQFSTRMGWGKARDGSVRRSPVFGRVLDSLRPLLLREVKCQMPNGRLPPNGKVCRHTVDIL